MQTFMTTNTRLRLAMLALMAITVSAMLSCGGSEDRESKESVSLALDWFPNSNHAGIYAAMANGYFDDEGLDVNVYTPSDPASVLQTVGSGSDDFGISYQTDLLQARNEGVPVIAVTAIVQHPLNSVMALKASGIERPSDLAGKKIGYPGIPSNEGLLATMLQNDGLTLEDVELIDIGFALTQSLASGAVDAVVGAYWTHESIVLELEGLPVNIMRMEEWGVPDFYELVLVTSEEMIAENEEVVQKLVKAFSRGFEFAQDNPQESINMLVELGGETVLEDVEREGVVLLQPMWEDGAAPRFGWQEQVRWDTYANWMKDAGLIEASLDPSVAFTNRFIEGASE